jgi:hypothetical protein
MAMTYQNKLDPTPLPSTLGARYSYKSANSTIGTDTKQFPTSDRPKAAIQNK